MSNPTNVFARKPLAARPGFWALLGPGLIWMAMAQGSGELIWWPYIIAKYGLAFLFLLIPACLLQFPLTFEIGRYTVLTGEGVFKGFFRLNRGLGIFLWVLFTLSFLWFGAFASAGGTALASLTNFPNDQLWTPPDWVPTEQAPIWWTARAQTLFWGQASIIVFTIAILAVRTVYRLIEWVMKIVAVVCLVGMIVACCHPDVRAQVGPFFKGLVVPDMEQMHNFDKADASRLLTAITFAGLGGFWTLFYSYWIREKGVGMASYAPKVTGFRTGLDPIRMGQAALPVDEPDASLRLRSWYRYLSLETAVGIGGNLITTLMMCLLAFALLHPAGEYPADFNIAVVQSKFFAVSWGTAGRALFLVVAAAFLADTWLATVDCVSRIHLDAIASVWPRFADKDQRPWYYGFVLLLAAITSITMFFNSPGPLIVTSAVIGFAGTVIYSTALIVLNHVHLRRRMATAQRSGYISLGLIVFVTMCYFALAVAFLYVQVPVWWDKLQTWLAGV